MNITTFIELPCYSYQMVQLRILLFPPRYLCPSIWLTALNTRCRCDLIFLSNPSADFHADTIKNAGISTFPVNKGYDKVVQSDPRIHLNVRRRVLCLVTNIIHDLCTIHIQVTIIAPLFAGVAHIGIQVRQLDIRTPPAYSAFSVANPRKMNNSSSYDSFRKNPFP